MWVACLISLAALVALGDGDPGASAHAIDEQSDYSSLPLASMPEPVVTEDPRGACIRRLPEVPGDDPCRPPGGHFDADPGAEDGSLSLRLSRLFARTPLRVVKRVADLPSEVAELLDVHGTFRMADPGEDWNPGCIRDPSNPEPDRLLIAAGISDSLVAVHYEQGGYAVHGVLAVVQLGSDGRAAAWCRFLGPRVATDPPSFAGDGKFPRGFNENSCEELTPGPST